MDKLDERYKTEKAPSKRGKYANWTAAKGLQAVDGLKTSSYLDEVAQRDIEGEIDAYRAKELIDSYYHSIAKVEEIERHAEADMVAARINILISEQAFTLSTEELVDIHARLFEGVYEFAGRIRTRNIIKYEWVLAGDTVTYGNAYNLRANVDSLMKQERLTPFRQMDEEERIYHLAQFCADLWQLHPFDEGNTRTTAVFFIKYLQFLGFNVTNDIFAKNAWYFRNAMVRANYNNLKKGIHETTEFLELFLRNLLLGEDNPLQNRTLHVSEKIVKQDFEDAKQDSETAKQDFDRLTGSGISVRTTNNVLRLLKQFGFEKPFGRMDIAKELEITKSPASTILNQLLAINAIVPVAEYGRGKYQFNSKFFK